MFGNILIWIIALIIKILMIVAPIFFVIFVIKIFFGKNQGSTNPWVWWFYKD